MRKAPAHYPSTTQCSIVQTHPLRNLRPLLSNDKSLSVARHLLCDRQVNGIYAENVTACGEMCKDLQCPTTNMVTPLPNRVFERITQIM